MKKTSKKLISFISALMIVHGGFMLPIEQSELMFRHLLIQAHLESQMDELEFVDHGEGVALKSCRTAAREIVIPDEVDGKPVTDIRFCAFSESENLERVILPDTIRTIGANAFSECYELAYVDIPDSVETIEEFAFYNCNALTEIVIPESVKNIEWCAFANCSNLVDVVLPETLEKIGYNAFIETPWLENHYREDSFLICNDTLFSAKERITKAVIPDGVKRIGTSAFEGCEYLSRVTIPDSVVSIGDYAFSECENLRKINIPYGVKKIGTYAFNVCDGLKTVNIPESITAVEPFTFAFASGLEYIMFPDSVEKIDERALGSCCELKYVTIENPDCEIFDGRGTISTDYADDDFYYMGTIYGHEGSTAQAYAEKYDVRFGIIGDVNADSAFTVADLLTMERYLQGAGEIEDWKAGDKDGSNNIDAFDMVLIRKQLVEMN